MAHNYDLGLALELLYSAAVAVNHHTPRSFWRNHMNIAILFCVANKFSGIGPPPNLRDLNTGYVLELLRREHQTTRTDLIRMSGLSKATMSTIVADMIQRGFAIETGKKQEGRGRSRVVLEFNPLARSVLGVQVEDDVSAIVLTDLNGREYNSTSRPVAGSGLQSMLTAVVDGATELSEVALSPIVGLGIGVPGNVDRLGRRIGVAVSHGWNDVPIADILEERLGLPVTAANRAKVAALGQVGHGQKDRPTDLIHLFLGRGVIAGIVIDGNLYFGRDGGAGDIGHVTVVNDGQLCGCGNRGCLHTVAGEQAILALARSRARAAGEASALYTLTDGNLARLTLPILAAAARDGDSAALSAVTEVGAQLGVVVANLVNTLNPEAVTLGGPGARLGQPLLNALQNVVHQRALTEASAKLDITVATHSEFSGAVGAATLWLTRAFANSTSLTLMNDPEPESLDQTADGT